VIFDVYVFRSTHGFVLPYRYCMYFSPVVLIIPDPSLYGVGSSNSVPFSPKYKPLPMWYLFVNSELVAPLAPGPTTTPADPRDSALSPAIVPAMWPGVAFERTDRHLTQTRQQAHVAPTTVDQRSSVEQTTVRCSARFADRVDDRRPET
jgi:hypothetical protein